MASISRTFGVEAKWWGLGFFCKDEERECIGTRVADFGSSNKYQTSAEYLEEMTLFNSGTWDFLFHEYETPSKGVPFKYVHEGQVISAREFGLKKVEFETRPFSCGKFREAYKGKVYFEQGQTHHPSRWRWLACWDLKEDRPSYPCIVKAFKRSHAMYAHEWTKDLEVLKEAQSYSEKFNKAGTAPVNIEFASAFLYQVFAKGVTEESGTIPALCPKRNRREAKVKSNERVCVEPFLNGTFVKANGNCGFVAKHRSETAEFFEVAQAFSHWTWVVSEKSLSGQLLICDLQGVFETSEGEKKWKFTDPAIHSAAGTQHFGQTDLGPRGINAFFYYHVCNEFCRHLRRPSVVIDVALPPVAPHTTFSFELVQISTAVHDQQDFANIMDHEHSKTCYAHATATVVRAAERRIVGRKLEEHHVMVQRLVDKYGTKGVPTSNLMAILKEECSPRKLQCREVDSSGAEQVIDLGRAIMLRFALTEAQWDQFLVFFKRTPSATLDSDCLSDSLGGKFQGHAVVIVGHDDKSWKIKNSWGDSFADGGYLQMSKSLVLDCNPIFFDVFWYEHDLTEDDLAAYERHCRGSNLRSV